MVFTHLEIDQINSSEIVEEHGDPAVMLNNNLGIYVSNLHGKCLNVKCVSEHVCI